MMRCSSRSYNSGWRRSEEYFRKIFQSTSSYVKLWPHTKRKTGDLIIIYSHFNVFLANVVRVFDLTPY